MKKRLVHIIAFVLLGIITPSAIGVPLFSHICNVSGHKDVSLLPVKECCPEEKESSALHALDNAPCCSDKVAIIKAEIPAIGKISKPVIEPSVMEAFSVPTFISYAGTASVINPSIQIFSSSGVDILHRISILRI